jgi:hypothetical protein
VSRSLRTPITEDQLAPLAPNENVLQFSSLPSEDQLRRIAELLQPRPDVALRVYGGYDGTISDLEFLRFFPFVRRFSADALYNQLTSIDGLRHLPPTLERLLIGRTRKRMSLAPIERFGELHMLFVEGAHKDFEVISGLSQLEDLTLRSVTLPDLSILLPLHRLRKLDLKLGGTRDIRLLPRIGRLQYVELWLIRGLDDVGPVAEVESLEHLFLQALKQVTRLPSFARSTELRRVDLQTMKGLTDLAPLAKAPNLEILTLIEMRHLRPDALRSFIGHPSLRAGIWDLGSRRKNTAAQDLLPLPPEPFGYAAARRGEPEPHEPPPWYRPDWDGFRSADV